MIRQKTVLVVGAGASCEAGLPLGVDLNEADRQKADLSDTHQ
jgi:hypothetical protein